ncbi:MULTISPECIES: pilus assembly protein CpaE [Yersinia]|uniref:pilus assembly protein CpaE n=1 Tax=Yersinia TaxID=629 RepID=UPI000BFD0967|nr:MULTISPECIES: pilus assembly protein CpaE [Yersinia]ATM87483.1 pilus assembly protein CpaE [Yersinia frederiksenii]MCB5319572.1 pilus assembly protein CpaE [Yersinia massiliensis]
MQLILNKDLISRKERKVKDSITIISNRHWLIEVVSEQIRLADMNNINEINKDIFNVPSISLSDQTSGVIVDIGDNSNVDELLALANNYISRHCWCVLVGDVDSISIAQQLTERGVLYLNIQSQSAELTQLLLKGIQVEKDRKAFFISVLGCKGGIGTTLLSYHLAHEVVQIKKLPTLLLQGNNGSQDLDLITEKKIASDLTEYQKNFDLMQSKDKNLNDISTKESHKYNFVVFDQPIHNSTKEKLTDYVEYSNCIIILLDNSMTSVRTAKEFIDIHSRFKRDNKRGIKLIICLNESRVVTKDMLDTSDIPSLLGRKIDIKIPYISKENSSISDKKYFGRRKKLITELTKQTLGMRTDTSKCNIAWINSFTKTLAIKR